MSAVMVNFFHVEINLMCSKCVKRMNDCDCIIPSFDLLNVFSTVMLRNSEMLFTATVKNHDNFIKIFEVTEEQKKFIIDYLKDGDGSFKHSMSERVDFSSDKSVIV